MDAAKATTTNNENEDQPTTTTSEPGAVPPLEPDATAGTPSEPAASTSSTVPGDPGAASASGASAGPTAAGASAGGPNAWQRMRSTVLNPENRWFLPLLGLVAYLLMLLTNFLADWIPFNDRTTSGVLERQPIALQPASWAFYIWLLIAVLLGAFVVLSLTPVGQNDVQVRRIIGFFIVSSAATILWQFFWHWEQLLFALIVVVVMWVSLLMISILGHRAQAESRLQTFWQKLMIQVPFSVALGWASVIMLLTFASWADRRWVSGNPFSDRGWAVILMIVGVAIAAAFALFARDSVVPLVFLWFFVAVVQQQWEHSTLIVVVAVVAAIASSALALAAYSLRFNPDALQRLSPRRRSVRPPTAPPT